MLMRSGNSFYLELQGTELNGCGCGRCGEKRVSGAGEGTGAEILDAKHIYWRALLG